MAQLSFDATTVAPQQSFDPIPAGVYIAHIIDSDVIATQSGGQMLKLTHEVLDGPYKGRRVWSNINIRNASAEAERIGQSQLSALCHAAGVLQLQDSAQLQRIPLRMRVTIRPAGPDKRGIHRDAQNDIKGYEAATGAAPAAPAMQHTHAAPAAAQQPAWQRSVPAAPPPAMPAAPAAAPWARRA